MEILGRGGARVRPMAPRVRDIFEQVRRAVQYHPDTIYAHAGENDLRDVDNDLLIQRLIELVHHIVAVREPHIIILSQLTNFPANSDVSGYSYRANVKLNEYFDSHGHDIRNTYVKVWKHTTGIFGPERLRWYAADDVHLNEAGLTAYAASVSTIVNCAYNHLQ